MDNTKVFKMHARSGEGRKDTYNSLPVEINWKSSQMMVMGGCCGALLIACTLLLILIVVIVASFFLLSARTAHCHKSIVVHHTIGNVRGVLVHRGSDSWRWATHVL